MARRFLLSKDDHKSFSCDKCDDDHWQKIHHHHAVSPILIVSLCVLAAGFLLLSYFAVVRWRSTRRRRTNPPPPEDGVFRVDIVDDLQGPVIYNPIWYTRTIGLPQSTIDSIQVFTYKSGQGLSEGSDCSVCLSEFEEEDRLRLLPKCSHAFHVSCIDTWLRSHKNCPVCRAPVMAEEGPSLSNSEVSEETESSVSDINETGDGIGRIRVVSDLGDNRAKVDQELEGVRRSVSMDDSSASRIYHTIAHQTLVSSLQHEYLIRKSTNS